MTDRKMTRQYLEDYAVGQVYRSGRLRVDKDQIIAFAAQFDPQSYHLDEAEAAANRMTALAKQVGAARVTTTAALSLLRGIRGDTEGAAAALREALGEDRRKGDVDSEIDHLSVLAEVLVKRGSAPDARKALAEFRTVASAHGYTQLVRDADALARLVK